ncbi:MAG: ATP-dependent DNA helicase [Clostridia bacterium]|nr:ATP-dependent DNA helicase [Clostridia bacterium]
MKYDRESGKILLTLGEFVTVARRRVAATAHDEDEPCVSGVSSRILRSIIGEHTPEALTFGFSGLGYSFELAMSADAIAGDEITVAREIESSPEKPRREELAEVRGEGFVIAHALCELSGLESVNLRFIYINSARAEHAVTSERVDAKKLASFFKKCVSAIEIYARPEVERVTKRLPSLASLKFPYSKIRDGQSEFVRTAYRTLARGGTLYASAPTGTGKTVSALYPALRVLGNGRRDKVFYLTPKATGAESVRECLELMRDAGAIVRSVILTAKDKCCLGGHKCRTSHALCELSGCKNIAEAALELYDMGLTVIDSDIIAPVALKHRVCPYELSLTYSELCDVVICDINYLFDPSVYIRRFFTVGGNFAFLIDEAHNLTERAREMYSAELSDGEISSPTRCELLGEYSVLKKKSRDFEKSFFDLFYPYVKEEIRERTDGQMLGAVNLSEIPAELYSLTDELLSVAESELRAGLRAEDEERYERIDFLKKYHYSLKKFADILARFDNAYKLFVFYEDGSIRIKLFCLDTGPLIRERLSKGAGALLFSATLSPLGYYRSVLGGDRSDDTLEVGSPFTPEQLSVSIMDKISTRYSEREDTLLGVCRVIAATVSAKRGNYIVFSPSFAYSEALARAFSAKYPKLHMISQRKDMTKREKEDFLAEFKKETGSYLVAFCVMGGIYSEGIDLAGDSLIGAVIVGIGIPSLSYEREAIAEYYQEKYEEGKQYAYIYPGMNRVFQAAGRVIRREDDKGVIVLIDDRFDDPIYKKSLPSLWSGVRFIDDAKRLRELLDDFWREE